MHQPQTKSFRGTGKIHLLSSVPPSNTQYWIQNICRSDTGEHMNIRIGKEIKSPFPFQSFHRHKSFPLILKYCHAHNRTQTLFLNCRLQFWANTAFGVFCVCLTDNFIFYKSEPSQVFLRYEKPCWTLQLNTGQLHFSYLLCTATERTVFCL